MIGPIPASANATPATCRPDAIHDPQPGQSYTDVDPAVGRANAARRSVVQGAQPGEEREASHCRDE